MLVVSQAVATSVELKGLHLDLSSLEDKGFRPGAGPGECKASSSLFSGASGVKTGLWRCEPGSFDVCDRANTESVLILAGKIRLTDLKKATEGAGLEKGSASKTAGASRTLVAGNIAVLELGSSVRWEILETCVKMFVIADTPQTADANKATAAKATEALALKDRGNLALKQGDVAGAEQLYTQAIEIDSSNHIFFGNRSCVRLKLKDLEGAAADGLECIKLDKSYQKGYLRLGGALEAQGSMKEAAAVYAEGTSLDPSNQSLFRKNQDVHRKLAAMTSETENNIIVDSWLETMADKVYTAPTVLHPLYCTYYTAPTVLHPLYCTHCTAPTILHPLYRTHNTWIYRAHCRASRTTRRRRRPLACSAYS
jgi:uncharacterized cupin superfamily protein